MSKGEQALAKARELQASGNVPRYIGSGTAERRRVNKAVNPPKPKRERRRWFFVFWW